MITYIKILLSFFDTRTRLQLAGFSFLMLIGAVIEMAGLSLFLPLLQVLSDPQSVTKYELLGTAVDRIGGGSPDRFVLVFSAFIFVFFVVKNLLLFVLVIFQNKFIMRNQAAFQRVVMRSYLFRPYTFHLGRNSAEIVKTVTISATMVFARSLLPLVNVVMESFLVIAVVIVLFAAEPVSTIIAVIAFTGSGALYYLATRSPFRRWSEQREQSAAEMIQAINQGVGSVKETKLMGRENYFLDKLSAAAEGQAHSQAMTTTFTQAPRFVTEIVAIGVLTLVFLVISLQGKNLSDAVPLLGLFVLATFRLVPSANRIISNLATSRSAIAAVETISRDLHDFPAGEAAGNLPTDHRPFKFEKSITVEKASFAYDGSDGPVLEDIELTIGKGESVAFVGASGAGKTTLADLILGLLDPVEGRILVDGADIGTNMSAWQRLIGYVPQSVFLTDDTVRRNIALGLEDGDIDEDAVEKAVSVAQLDDVIAQLPAGLDTVVGEHGMRISGGQRQRIGIARALYHDPEVLVFDEATSALDGEAEGQISAAIESLHGKKTVIIIAHRLSSVRHCDRLCYLAAGRIQAIGSFDELLESKEEFRRLVEIADTGSDVEYSANPS